MRETTCVWRQLTSRVVMYPSFSCAAEHSFRPRHVVVEKPRCADSNADTRSPNKLQIADFLDITPRLGQDLSDEFVSLQHAEGRLLRVRC